MASTRNARIAVPEVTGLVVVCAALLLCAASCTTDPVSTSDVIIGPLPNAPDPVVTVTSQSTDTTIAKGTTLTVNWTVDNPPTRGSIVILWDRDEDGDQNPFTALDNTGAVVDATPGRHWGLIQGAVALSQTSAQVETATLSTGLSFRVFVGVINAEIDSTDDLTGITSNLGGLELFAGGESTGRVSISGPQILMQQPTTDTTLRNPAETVTASWTVVGTSGGELVSIFLDPDSIPNNGNEVLVSQNLPLTQTFVEVNAFSRGPGTYQIMGQLLNSSGETITTEYAPGSIIVPNRYIGTIDLNDMDPDNASADLNRIDGAIFQGFNLGDRVGYSVSPTGDVNDDLFNEFVIFSRFSGDYVVGNGGAGYVIYGRQDRYTGVYELNNINNPVGDDEFTGTVLVGGLETAGHIDPVTGNPVPPEADTYFNGLGRAIGMPDLDGDGRGEMMVSAPEAAPIYIRYDNPCPSSIDIVDHYGLNFTLAEGGTTQTIIAHVQPVIVVTFNCSSPVTVWLEFALGDFTLGDYIVFTNTCCGIEVTIEDNRGYVGSSFLIQGDELARFDADGFTGERVYMLNATGLGEPVLPADSRPMPDNGWFVGHNAEYVGGGVWARRDSTGIRFADMMAPVSDLDGDGVSEIAISAPYNDAYDQVNLTASDAHRPEGGVGHILPSGQFPWTKLGGIGLAHLQPNTMWWEHLWRTSGSHRNSSPEPEIIDVIGASEGDKLGSLTGLGRLSLNGASLSGGDFNMDGYPDLAAGAFGYDDTDNGRPDVGAVYVIFGRQITTLRGAQIDLKEFNVEPDRTDPTMEVPILGVKIVGSLPDEGFGRIVRSAGDFDGDGLPDVMFSAPRSDPGGRNDAGRIYVVFGNDSLLGDFSVDDIGSASDSIVPGMVFEGQFANDLAGTYLEPAGDLNADGYDDILLSAPGADPLSRVDAGAVYVIYGKPRIDSDGDGVGDYVDLDQDGVADGAINLDRIGVTVDGSVFAGQKAGDRLNACAAVGDVDNDGNGDLLLGSAFADIDLGANNLVKTDAGRAYLVYGRGQGVPATGDEDE